MTHSAQEKHFLDLLQKHRKILYKVANAYTRTPEDRVDLVQEMILQLWRSFGRYDDTRRFSTWMYRVALNTAITFFRSESRRTRATMLVGDDILHIPDESPVTETENVRVLHRFIQELNELDRALVILYLDGHPHDTIAEVFGISSSNVGTRIGRIKQRLRRTWDELQNKEQTAWNSTH